MTVRDFTLFADYHQLYLFDAGWSGPDPDAWSTDNLVQKAIFAGDHVVVFTARNMEVPLRVEILPEAPDLELDGWDHVVDGALRGASGDVAVMGCTDEEEGAAKLPLAAGTYRVRVSMAGLETLSEDGLDGADRYRVQIWPGPWRETAVRIMHEPEGDG
jgi:hypothetical protein